MRAQPELHPPDFPVVAWGDARRTGRSAARIRGHSTALWTTICAVATGVLGITWTVAGLLVLRELVRWFAEVPGPLPTRFGGWLIP